MAGSLNKVSLIGNVGRDPDIKTWPDGNKTVTFSMATTETWKDRTTGEKKDETEWHNIVIKNQGLAIVAEKYVKKGDKLYIEGKLKTRMYTSKEGGERSITEVVVAPMNGTLLMMGGPSGGKSVGTAPDTGGKPWKESAVEEDEIPF